MRNTNSTRQVSKTLFTWATLFTAFLLPALTYAAPGLPTPQHTNSGYPDVVYMLESLQANMPSLNMMVSGFAYVAGIYLIFGAIYKLKQYGEARTMTSSNTDMRGPLVSLAVGAMMLFLPTTVDTLLTTFYGSNEITQYTVEQPDWAEATKTIIMIVNFVGIVAIVRGLFYLNRAGSGQGGQQNHLGRGVTHLVAGVIGLNIIQAKDILYATLGLS